MTMDPATIPGIEFVLLGAAAALWLIERLVWVWRTLASRNGSSDRRPLTNGDLKRMMEQTDDLWEWHNVDLPGEPGVKIWWMKGTEMKRTRELLERLIVLMERQQELLEEHRNTQKMLLTVLQELAKAVRSLEYRFDEEVA